MQGVRGKVHEPRAQAAWEERENDGEGKRHAQLSAASTTWRPRPARSGVCPGARVAQDDLRRVLKLREGILFLFFLDLFRDNKHMLFAVQLHGMEETRDT